MAQLVLGAAGAIIGSFVPGVGTALGWAIGSAVGSLIDPPKGPTVEGPKLTDLKTQTSDYGTVLPVVYGTVRIAGNVLWSDDIKETRNKEKQGKGGGGGQTTISYTYSLSFAIGLCQGVIAGIRRIWANGEVIYSAAESSNAGTLQESGKMNGRFRVYTGTEDQITDPTYEAVHPDTAIPFKGVAHVVFTDLQLAKYGNRPPNLEFEVVKAGETVDYTVLRNEFQTPIMSQEEWQEQQINKNGFSNTTQPIQPRFVSANGAFYRLSSPVKLQNGNQGNDVAIAPGKIFEINATDTKNPLMTVINSQSEADRPGPFQEFSKTMNGDVYDMGSICKLGPQYLDLFVPRSASFPPYIYHRLSDPGKLMWGGQYLMGIGINVSDSYKHAHIDVAPMFPAEHSQLYFQGAQGSGDQTKFIVFAGPDPYYTQRFGDGPVRQVTHWFIFELVGGLPRCTRYGEMDRSYDVASDLGGWGLPFGMSSYSQTTQGCLDTDGETYWCFTSQINNELAVANVGHYKIGSDNVMRFVTETTPSSEYFVSSSDLKSVFAVNGVCIAYRHNPENNWGDKDLLMVMTTNSVMHKEAIPLTSIIADQLEAVGFDPSEFDTSELQEELVDGFFLANRPSVRTAIETLTSPYFFDVVESDTVLKFVRRGKPPVRTLHYTQMGATYGDVTDRPDALIMTRQQELSQPREISAQYQDREADYRIAVQYARRQITQAVNQVSVQLPLVLSATKAKQVVDTVLFNQTIERDKFEWATDRTQIDLEPTDIINLISEAGNTYTVRITTRAEGGDGTIKWEAVGQEASVYDALAEGVYVPPTTGEQVIGSVPTFQIVFNAPPLNNAIDAPGFYVAASGYTVGWNGSIAQRSLDGVTYSNLEQSVVTRGDNSTMGFVMSTLGDWKGGNTLDTQNFVMVNVIGGGELNTASYNSVLNGANAFWIGGEIVQFEKAEQLSATQYKLTKLRRGRFGTERFIAAHKSNEQFALLGVEETQFQPEALGNAGVQQLVRGVTLNSEDASSVPSQNFVFDASTIRPLSPVHAFAIEQPSGEIQCKWVRRARINAEWLDSIEVPLDEPTELYALEIASDSNFENILRVTETTTPTYIYSVADRLLDTSSTSSEIFVRVYQMSSRVGRGHHTTLENVK